MSTIQRNFKVFNHKNDIETTDKSIQSILDRIDVYQRDDRCFLNNTIVYAAYK